MVGCGVVGGKVLGAAVGGMHCPQENMQFSCTAVKASAE